MSWSRGHASGFLSPVLEVGDRWRVWTGGFVQCALVRHWCELPGGFAKETNGGILIDWMVMCDGDAYLEKWTIEESVLLG